MSRWRAEGTIIRSPRGWAECVQPRVGVASAAEQSARLTATTTHAKDQTCGNHDGLPTPENMTPPHCGRLWPVASSIRGTPLQFDNLWHLTQLPHPQEPVAFTPNDAVLLSSFDGRRGRHGAIYQITPRGWHLRESSARE